MNKFNNGGYITGPTNTVTTVNAGEWVIKHKSCAHSAFLDTINDEEQGWM